MMTCDGCRRSTAGCCTRHPAMYATGGVVFRPAVAVIPGLRLATAADADGTLVTPDALCPDLLRYEQIGAADGPRGRLVRAFFWLLRAWPPERVEGG